MLRFFACIFLAVSLGSAGFAQEIWRYPPVTVDEATSQLLEEAGRRMELHQFDKSIEIYLDLAEQHSGQSLGVECLTRAMMTAQLRGNTEVFETLRQRLATEYSDSFQNIKAQLRAVENSQSRAGNEALTTAYSDFLEQRYGAPRPDDILAGRDLEGAVQKARGLHPETRLGVMIAYYGLCYMKINEEQWEEAIRMASFGREAFDSHPLSDNKFTKNLAYILERQTGNRFVNTQPAEPRLTVLSPAPGSTVGIQPTIVFRMSSGDYRKARIAMTSLVLKVDGVDQALNATVDSAIDTSLQEGVDFEVLTVTYRPTLSPGSHTVEVLARGLPVPNSPPETLPLVTETWSFIVSDNPPPPPPTTETRPATKDALVYEKSPHSNEGANPILTLEKINGKAARNLLGFDLTGVNTNSLTSATLVLSIDPSDQVSGWGNGETVTVKPVTVAWQEGNGKKHGLPGNQQTAGSGAGTTWFSPTDENISNNSSNGVVQWSGGAVYATTGTAPSLTVHNQQTGELRFDVTDDVLNGVTHGWLLRKDAENKGSKVSFYSREGGGANLGPRLILEYGGPTAMSVPQQIYSAVAGFFGITTRPVSLQASSGVSESPKSLKEFLRGCPRTTFVGEQVMLGFVGRHPLTQLGARVVYRSWLRETPSLV